MKKYFLLLIIPAVLICSCSSQKKEKKKNIKQTERAETVRTTIIEKSTIAHYVNFASTLEGYEHINIAPSIGGRIVKIYVDLGSTVSYGDNLIQMDPNQYNSSLLTYNNLKTEMARLEELIKTGSISQQIYDQTKTQLNQAEESVNFLSKNTFIKAPFAGVISSKNYQENEMFTNMPILTLTQIQTLKAMINIPEAYFNLVKKNMTADVKSDLFPNKTFKGTVEIISPTIDPITHTFQVKIKIPNKEKTLRPGMYTSVGLALGETEAFIVPYSSVLKVQGSNDRYVYINNKGYAKRVNVTLGQRFDDKIEIFPVEPIDNYELIIAGQGKLVNGTKLIVK